MKLSRFWKRLISVGVAALVMALFGTSIIAQDTPAMATADDISNLTVAIDTTWVMLTAFLVFFMQCGFAMLEAGLINHKGVVNALLENFIDASLTGICFWLVGFGLAFGESSGGLFGTSMFAIGMESMSTPFGSLNVSVMTFFFFQFAFAATASTIATGAMAERTDFVGDLVYSALMALFIYPIVVHWVWGGGWLAQLGFHDFAGSTVVHTVGGVVALIGAILVGPRAGRVFGKAPAPHNMALAVLGTMILWFGWYGFNPGSTVGAVGMSSLIGLVTFNTTLGACAGALSTMMFMYFRTGKWDLALTLNGSLAGLVAITAGCAFVAPTSALFIGIAAGIVVILAADAVERAKIDDAVGAFAVHGACGILGTVAIGLFADASLTLTGQAGLLMGGGVELLGVQAVGSLATIVWVAVTGTIMFTALKMVGHLRVDKQADIIGIDLYEHGASAWPDVLPIPSEGTVSDEIAMDGKATAPAGD